MKIQSSETFEGVGGLKLHSRIWRPEGATRGVVVICHGFKAHSGLYEWPAEQFAQRGLAVYALDLRGHGRSEGERYFNESFANFTGDLDKLVDIARAREPGLPVFLLGHSAGGVISSVYALEHPEKLTGFICESFAFQVPAPDVALAILKGVSHVAPHAHLLDLKDDDFSRDPAFVTRMKTDPLIPHMAYPALTVAEMVRTDERLKREFPLFRVPVLILHGTADKVTRPSGSQLFFDTTGSKDKALKLYEGHAHDLLNDVGRDQVMADITEWITVRLRS
jgi:acylglycerol lipase